jgi:aminoglycoside phosphotransferase (APT) family kinase protein
MAPALPSLLGDAGVAALVATVPGNDAGRARRNGEGWEVVVYRTGDWVVRLPKAPRVPRVIERQTSLYRILAAAGLPVPRDACVVTGPGGEVIAGVHRHVDGRPASTPWPPALAGDIGGFLTALHAVPVARLDGICPVIAEPWRERLAPLVERCRPALPPPLRTWIDDRAANLLAEGAGAAAPPVLIHGDLSPAHVRLDAAGAIAGVIDFLGPQASDAAIDFATLAERFGAAFARRALAAYGGRTDTGFHARVCLYRDLRPLVTIDFAGREGDAEKMRRGLRRLDVRARRAATR